MASGCAMPILVMGERESATNFSVAVLPAVQNSRHFLGAKNRTRGIVNLMTELVPNFARFVERKCRIGAFKGKLVRWQSQHLYN